jgi:hypothetical protein
MTIWRGTGAVTGPVLVPVVVVPVPVPVLDVDVPVVVVPVEVPVVLVPVPPAPGPPVPALTAAQSADGGGMKQRNAATGGAGPVAPVVDVD